jgi:hypothetical protein
MARKTPLAADMSNTLYWFFILLGGANLFWLIVLQTIPFDDTKLNYHLKKTP